MPYSPVIAGTGLNAWRFLKASEETQTAIFDRSPDIERDIEYFTENISEVSNLDDLMSDRRLLKVALGAFSLGDEINKGAFVRKVLEDGTETTSAFAVRLNNPDYLELAKTFAVGDDGSVSVSSSQIADMVDKYKTKEYEVAVGNVDNNMRLALNFERSIAELASAELSEDAGWFKAMASVPIRTVLEGAFNLPTGFSQLDIDRQKEILSDKSNALFGGKTVDIFKDPEVIDQTIRRFLLTEQLNSGPSSSTPGFAAISILNGGLGSTGITNLLLSNA